MTSDHDYYARMRNRQWTKSTAFLAAVVAERLSRGFTRAFSPAALRVDHPVKLASAARSDGAEQEREHDALRQSIPYVRPNLLRHAAPFFFGFIRLDAGIVEADGGGGAISRSAAMPAAS